MHATYNCDDHEYNNYVDEEMVMIMIQKHNTSSSRNCLQFKTMLGLDLFVQLETRDTHTCHTHVTHDTVNVRHQGLSAMYCLLLDWHVL